MKRALYTVYLTGSTGSSLALFYIGDGIIAGIDVGGMQYDGSISDATDGGFEGLIDFIIPAGQALITGLTAPPTAAQRIAVPIHLPSTFADGSVIRIETSVGPVNARFEKMKELDER